MPTFSSVNLVNAFGHSEVRASDVWRRIEADVRAEHTKCFVDAVGNPFEQQRTNVI